MAAMPKNTLEKPLQVLAAMAGDQSPGSRLRRAR